jgi:hypothetical protein
MALPFSELEAITNDYFAADQGKAIDIYFKTSFLLNYLMKQQKGLWERPIGGRRIRVPLEYDEQVGGFYSKGETLSSDDRESLMAAYFEWKHCYSNATIYRIDELKNEGEFAEVQLVAQRVAGAQKTITKILADSIYDAPSGSSNRLTGMLALCNETSSLAYGAIAEDDLVSSSGDKMWEGKVTTTTEKIGLHVIRVLATSAKIRDGMGGRPDLVVMTQALWDIVADILQAQQRFKNSDNTANAGFTGLHLEGKDIFPDDFCPSGYMFALNSNHLGFAVHKRGYFVRAKWKVIPDSAEDRSMKIYWDGNAICNNRKGHAAHSNLS